MSGPASGAASGAAYPMWSKSKGYLTGEVVKISSGTSTSGAQIMRLYKKKSNNSPPVAGPLWKLLTSASGPSGSASGPAAPLWSPSIGYLRNDIVTYNNQRWQKLSDPPPPNLNIDNKFWDNFAGGGRTKRSKKSRKGKKASRRR